MVNNSQTIKLTLSQQMTLSKLQTKLDALRVKRDEIVQDISEFIHLVTIELNIPKGSIFDQKSMAFIIPQTEPQQPTKE